MATYAFHAYVFLSIMYLCMHTTACLIIIVLCVCFVKHRVAAGVIYLFNFFAGVIFVHVLLSIT